MTLLDLNKFPEFENVQGFLKYNPFEEFPELINLGDISERIYGCAEFIWTTGDKQHPFWLENLTLRAFLNEFASLNEMIKASQNEKIRNLAIENVDIPLFHFFKLLRNVNFHVKSSRGGNTEFEARFQNKKTGVVHGDLMKIKRYIISDCSLILLKTARDIRYYDESDIQYIIDWVNYYQMKQGISNILEETLRQYCKLLKSILP